jgi:hypothetical protein
MAREPGDGEETFAKRVLETGIALVHANEVVVPEASSKAQAELVAEDTRTIVEYHFPVEIEIRGDGGTIDISEIAGYVYERLAKRLQEGR